MKSTIKDKAFKILDNLDGINYSIEDMLNNLFRSDTDYLYRQYVEALIENIRMKFC